MALTIEALNASKDLVAQLADKNVILEMAPGSPVAEAISATKTRPWSDKLNCLSEIDALPASLYETNTPIIQNGEVQEDPHSVYMDTMASQLGIVLANHVSYATTVVLPVVAEMHDRLKTVLDLEQTCGIRSYKVEKLTGSPLFDVDAIVSEIEKFGNLDPHAEQKLVLDYKPLNDEEIVGLMKIGADMYDGAIDQFVSQVGIATVREVWDVVFSGEHKNFANYDLFRADRETSQARNFTTFLIASRLIQGADTNPEVTGLAGMSSAKYPVVLRNLMEVSGAALFVALERARAESKAGKLIEKIDGKTVFVNSSVYDRFMNENNGDVETILGCVVSGAKTFYLPEILENVEKYKTAWTYHVGIAKQNAKTNMLVDVRRAVSDFTRQFVRTTDDEVVKANAATVVENMDAFSKSIYTPALDDVDSLALKAVAVIFNHCDADKILFGVTEAMRENPGIDKEDALNLSVTKYVAEWFAEQIDVAE